MPLERPLLVNTLTGGDGLFIEFTAGTFTPPDLDDVLVDTWVLVNDRADVQENGRTLQVTATIRPDNFSGSGQYPDVPTDGGWGGTITTSGSYNLRDFDELQFILTVEGGSQLAILYRGSDWVALTGFEPASETEGVQEEPSEVEFLGGSDTRLETISQENSERKAGIVPKLVQDGDGIARREFQPNTVTRLGGTLPWDTSSTQLQCGETVTEVDGDMNIRLNMECIATHTDFLKLAEMRQRPAQLRIISAPYSGPATFDQLKFEQLEDANGAIVRGQGLNEEPRYRIQLQSKEENEGENDGPVSVGDS